MQHTIKITFDEKIELYEEKKALYYDGMMGNDYVLVKNILTKFPQLINEVIDVPMDEEDAEIEDFSMGITPLLGAISFTNLMMVKMLIEDFYADINKGNYDKCTPIFHISYSLHNPKNQSNRNEIFDYLLSKNVDVNRAAITGKTPLMNATQCGDLDKVTKLLKHGADTKSMDLVGFNVFHWLGYYDGPQKTLEDKKNIDGIVQILLESGANLNSYTNEGMTPLEIAEEYEKPMVVKVFKQYL